MAITPEEPMWLAGYAKRTRPAEGKVGELFAKALVLEDSTGNKLVILTADLIAMPRDISDWLATQCAQKFGLRRDQLLLITSHTHSGPEIRPEKAYFFDIPDEFAAKIPPYVQSLRQKMLSVIEQAIRDLQAARVFSAKGQARFAHNRRPGGGCVDYDVPVLRVEDDNAKPRAILFGYACHNTTLWDNSYVYCGDYAGFAQQYLEDQFPGSHAMFLCGCAADQNPEPLGELAYAQKHGQELAEAVCNAMNNAEELAGSLHTAFTEVPLDFQPIPPQQELKEQTKSSDKPTARKAKFLLDHPNNFAKSYPCPVQTIRLGDQLLLIALGGEPVAEYAVKLRSLFPQKKFVWIAGYANDMFGYLPTARVQREGGYEAGRAMLWSALPMPWTNDVEPRVIAAVQKLTAEENAE